MAITQSELVTALQTLLNTVKFRIRNRYGVESVLDLNRMKAGELVLHGHPAAVRMLHRWAGAACFERHNHQGLLC